MKYNFILLILAFSISCTNNSTPRYSTTSPEVESTKALISAYDSGDWENWKSYYSDTVKIYHNSLNHVSADQLSQGFQETLENFDSYGFGDHESYFEMVLDDKNETWTYFWGTWKGTHKDSVSIDVPVHVAFRFVEGKIVREYAYYDNQIIENALASSQEDPKEELEE